MMHFLTIKLDEKSILLDLVHDEKIAALQYALQLKKSTRDE
jgi:hypothetical protein